MSLAIRAPGEDVWATYPPGNKLQTDKEGRFRIEALLPGFEYMVGDRRGYLSFGDGLRSAETKDLGDVKLKRGGE